MPLIDTQPDAVAITYASALYQLASSTGGQTQVEACLSELEDLLEMGRVDKKFGEFLSSRIISADHRQKSLGTILQGKVSDITLRFLQILNRKGRLSHLPAIVSAYDQQVQRAFGRVEIDAYTASPLSHDEKNEMQSRLGAKLGCQVVLHSYVDEGMLGGVKFQIGDQLIDGSVAAQVRRLRDQLTTKGTSAVRAAADRIIKNDPGSNGH